jgi:putative nucleotidyltransferase with HDIG domain
MSSPSFQRPFRLLIVDDMEAMRMALEDSLRFQGYDALSVGSAEEALDRLRSEQFDLLLTDQAMPGLSGIELAEATARIHPDMPIVLLTGHTDVELAKASLQRGASDYVTKPVNIHELPIVIERNLTRHRMLLERLKEREAQVMFEAIKALASAVDAKDPYTARHSMRVTRLSLILADGVGLPSDDRYVLELSAWMHDVGKIGVPDHILTKGSPLTKAEFEIMKIHAPKGGEIVRQIEELTQVADVIRHHHERWDGRGYPDGLRGKGIPLLSRIILIADCFEAMTSDRSYRPGTGRAHALEELHQHAGSQFDPELADIFLRKIEGLPDA